MEYEITKDADLDAVFAAVREGIRGADPTDVGPRDWQPLNLALRARDGTLVGGLYGATMWKWLLIDGLWVAEELRGRGLGRDLLLAGEAAAIDRGCRGSWLGTFDFQARGFYERLGYTVFAELTGFPPGHTHYHLRKDFTNARPTRIAAPASERPATP
ncbi:MAG TPA: GNAT family N-acetyltransferase [Gemmatimonadaceae bacterium]|jgi:GNAT superfamily N-acetyltransferase